MNFKNKLKSIFQNEWMIAAVFLGLFLLTHGYRFGWDDHFAEIPHLKNLIDPTLYTNDPFVTSLRNHFPTFFYRILSQAITIEQIPAAYFFLFLISRYFLFFWIYKFWLLIAGHKLEAFFCSLTAMVLVREQHFLYLTFSHAEFAYPFVFAGIYYFHKERFLLAAAILGIAVNFHALYGLLPMIYMCGYLLFMYRKHGFMTLIKSGLLFVACMSPLLVFTLITKASLWTQPLAHAWTGQDWISLCQRYMPEHFFFPATFAQYSLKEIFTNFYLFLGAMEVFLFLGILYVLNVSFNTIFRQNFKSHLFVLMAFLLLGVCFTASYIIPNKFLIGLQLIRNAHFLLFILPGYTTLLLLRAIGKQRLWACLAIGLFYTGLIPRDLVSALCTLNIFMLLLLNAAWDRQKNQARTILSWGVLIGVAISLGLFIGFLRLSHNNPLSKGIFKTTAIALLFLSAAFGVQGMLKNRFRVSKRLFIMLPLTLLALAYTHAHYKNAARPRNAFDQFQDAWVDIQLQTKKLTPKDSVILAPYDTIMGGFRIFSERSMICEERDIGAFLAFDVEQVYQWEKRMSDIQSFKTSREGNILPAVFLAIKKYNAQYIVFPLKYFPQPSKTLELLYKNQLFSLYKINRSK